MGVNSDGNEANCAMWGWSYLGIHAQEHFDRHLGEHVERERQATKPKMTKWGSDLLRSMKITPPEEWM